MKLIRQGVISAAIALLSISAAVAQAPAAPPLRLNFWVTSPAWSDGGVIPMTNSGRGENKSPAFEFHWSLGTNPVAVPASVQSYALIMHDMQNANNKGPVDTLHWTVYNIPGTATGLPAGLGAGKLPDGTENGPGVQTSRGNPPSYFGPGAPAGPFHHYVVEFYALDTKLNFVSLPTRDELLKAMEGHVVGKAAYFGRFPAPGE